MDLEMQNQPAERISSRTQAICMQNQKVLEYIKTDDDSYDHLWKECPNMRKALSGKLGQILYRLYEEIKHHDMPMYTGKNELEYYRMPMQWLIKRYGGSKQTYVRYLRLARVLYLLRQNKATGESTELALVREYLHAKATRRQTAWYYAVVPLNESTLKVAEERYCNIMKIGLNPKCLTRENIASLIGVNIAKKIYMKESIWQTKAQQYIENNYLLYLNKTREYDACITKDELQDLVYSECVDNILSNKPQRLVDSYRLERHIENVWRGQSRRLLQETGMSYHRPTKEQKAKYELFLNEWIIAPIGG